MGQWPLWALSALLFFLAFTDVFLQKQLMGFALAAFYFLWGCSWLLQLFTLRRKAIDYLLLGHWFFLVWLFRPYLLGFAFSVKQKRPNSTSH